MDHSVLWREAALLDRLLYKNRMQHGKTGYYHQLQGVRGHTGAGCVMECARYRPA